MEVRFDGIDGHLHGVRDLLQVHLLLELHEKDGALVRREGFKYARKAGDLFACDELGFGCGLLGCDEGCDVVDVDGGSFGLLPELELLRSLVIANEIDRDAGEPGIEACVSAEGSTCIVGFEQAVLGDGLGEVGIARGVGDEAEDARPVGSDQRIDVVEFADDLTPCPKSDCNLLSAIWPALAGQWE